MEQDERQHQDHDPQAEGESEAARLYRLGRERPKKLGSRWKEIGFVFSIVFSQCLNEYFISGVTVLVPELTEPLGIPPARITWPVAAFSLVISGFLLPAGRLADIYGGKWIYTIGIIWTALWALIIGFAQNEIMLDVCRAIQGLGPACYLPAGLQLLGSTYRPGPRKNIAFSIYGSMAALGFFVGVFFAGVVGEYATWRWYFWIGAILAAFTSVVTILCIDNDYEEHKGNGIEMDWLGAATTIVGLVLFVYAVTDSAHAPDGWRTPYILATFILGIVILAAAFYIEGWVAEQPLLPFEAFKIKYVRPFVLGLFLTFGACGIFILYATLYVRNILGVSPMLLVAWYVPMGVGGVMLATIGGFVFHLIHGNILLLITGLAIIVNSVLFAVMPEKPGYWPWVFPAMCCATLAVDVIFTAASIFFTTTMPSKQQGFAGALTNVIFQLGIAVMLGFADVVVSNTASQGERQSYQNAFWFELAAGVAAVVVFMGFVRMKAAKSDKTADEKAEEKAVEEKGGVAS